MMKRIALALIACLWASLAFGQANNSNTWQTPGNQTVGGVVQMCVNTTGQAVPCASAVAGAAGFPNGATAVTNSATGAAAAATATLPAAATKTTYICGYQIGSTATAAAAGNATITGTIGGTLNVEMGTGVSPAVVMTQSAFTPCVPASGVNTAIAVNTANPGTGGVISVTAWGFQL